MTTLRPIDVARAAERTAPQAVADHDRVGESGHGVLGPVDASELRHRAEQLKVIGARDHHLDPLGPFAADERRADRPQRRHALEDAGAVAQVVELGLRDADVAAVGRARVRRDAHETIRIRKWQRADQHGVDDGEDRDVCADAEGQRQNRRGGESGRGDDASEAVAQIAQQGIHCRVMLREPDRSRYCSRSRTVRVRNASR